jgi:hypothetical protein
MKAKLSLALAVFLGFVACKKHAGPTEPPRRMEVRKMTNSSVYLVPGPEELPYCLVFTRSATGVTRQLTMTETNDSVDCTAGQPILGVRFRVPPEEGKVKIYTFFSDQRLQAAVVADQLVDLLERPTFSAMDLRAPGRLSMDVEEFLPAEDINPVEGEMVDGHGADGGLRAADGGTPTALADGGATDGGASVAMDAATPPSDAGAPDLKRKTESNPATQKDAATGEEPEPGTSTPPTAPKPPPASKPTATPPTAPTAPERYPAAPSGATTAPAKAPGTTAPTTTPASGAAPAPTKAPAATAPTTGPASALEMDQTARTPAKTPAAATNPGAE